MLSAGSLTFTGIALTWLATQLAVERMWPKYAAAADIRVRRWVSNGVMGCIDKLLLPVLMLPMVAWASGLEVMSRPAWMDGFLGLLFTILVLDFVTYWTHRLAHRWSPLWALHQVHHMDEALDATTAVRDHPLEVLVDLCLMLPVIALFGIPVWQFLVFELVYTTTGFFHHCAAALPPSVERVLKWIVVVPSAHFCHHHDDVRDTDSNFGAISPWWDMLFGTWNTRTRTPRWRMGIDYSRDLNVLSLLLLPFRRRASWAVPVERSQSHEAASRAA